MTAGRVYCIRGGIEFDLPEDLVDMRAISKALAFKHSAIGYTQIKPAFAASFSRAVKGLVARGLLVPRDSGGRREKRFYKLNLQV